MKNYFKLSYLFIAAVLMFTSVGCSKEEFNQDAQSPSALTTYSSDDFDPYTPFAYELIYDASISTIRDKYLNRYFPLSSMQGSSTQYDYTLGRYYLKFQYPNNLIVSNEERNYNTFEDDFQYLDYEVEIETKIPNVSNNMSYSFMSCEDDMQNICDFGLTYNNSTQKWSLYYSGMHWNIGDYNTTNYPIQQNISGKVIKIKLRQLYDNFLTVEVAGQSIVLQNAICYINPFYITTGECENVYSFKIESQGDSFGI